MAKRVDLKKTLGWRAMTRMIRDKRWEPTRLPCIQFSRGEKLFKLWVHKDLSVSQRVYDRNWAVLSHGSSAKWESNYAVWGI